MHYVLEEHFEKALGKYTSGDYYQVLLQARDDYFKKTGQLNDDDDDYESRMNSFNEWYLIQYIPRNNTRSLLKDYLLENKIEEEVSFSFLESNFSIYEYLGENWRKNVLLRDVVHRNKIIMAKDCPMPGMLKHDIFLGRVISFRGENTLLPGISMLPKEVKPVLVKKSKQILKQGDPTAVGRFLIEVEKLKNKWRRYGHLQVTKLFVFED